MSIKVIKHTTILKSTHNNPNTHKPDLFMFLRLVEEKECEDPNAPVDEVIVFCPKKMPEYLEDLAKQIRSARKGTVITVDPQFLVKEEKKKEEISRQYR